MYFLRGSLPWQNMKANNKKEKYERIMEKKLGTPIEILCKGFPNEFVTYLSYCRNLKFDDKPDYNYLKNLFKDLFTKSGFENDYQYDWNVLARKKKDEKKDINDKEDDAILVDINESSNQKPTDDKVKTNGQN